MKRILYGSAIALFVAGPLAAQQATDPAATTQAVPGGTILFIPAEQAGDTFASDLIGASVYSSDQQYPGDATMPVTSEAMSGWSNIGSVNDLVVSQAGTVRAVLVDVGGFLGMGSHTVALDMSQVHVLRDEAGAQFVAVTSTREELQAAPAFERDAITTSATAPTPIPPGAMPPAPGVVRPDFVREGFQPVDYATVAASQIEGASVYDANDRVVGRIGQVLLESDGKVSGAVVDVGGFLGIGARPVMISFGEMQILANADRSEMRIFIGDTEDQLRQRPEYVEG